MEGGGQGGEGGEGGGEEERPDEELGVGLEGFGGDLEDIRSGTEGDPGTEGIAGSGTEGAEGEGFAEEEGGDAGGAMAEGAPEADFGSAFADVEP